MRFILWLIVLMLPCITQAAEAPKRWAVYYSDQLTEDRFLPFDLLVFDSTNHPPLQGLKQRGKVLIGYLSLGEAENYRDDFAELKKRGLLLAENEAWKGHFIIDIRKPAWIEYILEQRIPAILQKGFDGVMLDTADSLVHLEEQDGKKYAGMKQATVDAIRAIRMHYPTIKIMLNRGFPILPEVAPSIDSVLAESIYAQYDMKTKRSGKFPEEVYTSVSQMLVDIKAANPNLSVYSLDYWQQDDVVGVKSIYTIQREKGFIPYVSTLDLQQVYPEPQ